MSFVSYRRATQARRRAAYIEECTGDRGFRAIGEFKPRGPAIKKRFPSSGRRRLHHLLRLLFFFVTKKFACFRRFSIYGTSGNSEMPRIYVPTANPTAHLAFRAGRAPHPC